MPKYYDDINQGTDEWHALRCGVVTASTINTLITPTGKLAGGEKVKTAAYEIIAERETKRSTFNVQTFAMLRGHVQEIAARSIYSETYDAVDECGFVTEEFYGVTLGMSPDGLVGRNGGIEIKSRDPKFQISTIAKNVVPREYMNQIQTCLMVSGREWWDFVQYCPGLPLFVKRVTPDEERQDTIKSAVIAFESLIGEIQDDYNAGAKGRVETEYIEFSLDDEIEASE